MIYLLSLIIFVPHESCDDERQAKRHRVLIDEEDDADFAAILEDLAGGFASSNPLPSTAEDRYSEAYLRSLDDRTRALLVEQIADDYRNVDSIPDLTTYTEYIQISSVLNGQITLGPLVSRQKFSVLYAIQGYPNLLIKYQVNCEDFDSIHPLLRDYWFQKLLEGTGIATRVFTISPPATFSLERTSKTDFLLSGSSRLACAGNPHAEVRYMIVERAAVSLSRLSLPTDLASAFKITREVVRKLKVLHSHGIVHGDIHAGNIVLSDIDSLDSVTFIDFGRSFFLAEKIGKREKLRLGLSHVHILYSPFELRGFRPSYRDDVFGAITALAFLLNGMDWYKYCESLPGRTLMKFKNKDFMFSIPRKLSPIERSDFPRPVRLEIYLGLLQILGQARSVHAINAHPNYDIIIEHLTELIALTDES